MSKSGCITYKGGKFDESKILKFNFLVFYFLSSFLLPNKYFDTHVKRSWGENLEHTINLYLIRLDID